MKLRDIVLASVIGAGSALYAGCDGDNTQSDADADTDGDAIDNHAPTPIDGSSVTPVDGSVYDIGDLVPLAFTVPTDEDGDELNGTIVVTGDSDAVAGPSAGDYTNTVALGDLTPGARLTHDINTATAGPSGAALPTRADGTQTPYTLEIIVSDGQGGEARLARNVGLNGGSANPARVTGCNVSNSSVGAGLAIRCHGESSAGTITEWNLTGGPTGAIILNDSGEGAIARPGVLGASDVRNHTYNVTCSDGTNTSDVYTFTVPVDEHVSTIMLDCGGDLHNLLQQETTVDTVASACAEGSGFNPVNKPSDSLPIHVYVVDLDEACVQGAIATLTPGERAAHRNYNNGTTVDDVYSSCTVTTAQAKYEHN
jgi:hypothetical protein